MKALIPLYVASLKEFIRDRMALFWTLAFPIFFMLIFGVVFGGNDETKYEVALVIEDEGQLTTQIIQALEGIELFELQQFARDAALEALADGDVRAVILVQEGTNRAIAAREPAPVAVYYDPTSQTAGQVIVPIVEQLLDAIDRQISGAPRLLSVDARTVSGDRLTGIDFLVPGILGMALMQLGLFGTAPQLVQLREQQVLRRLGATPLPRATLLASQVLLRLTIGFVQAALLLSVGSLVFDVQIGPRPTVLIALVLLGALMFISLGYLVASLAKSQESVQGISSILQFPMMFLSGLFFPVEFVPGWLQPLVMALPLTYLADALRQTMLGSPPLYPLLTDVLVLTGWLVASALLSVRLFRWE